MVKNILLLLFVSFCLSAAAQSPKFKLVTTQVSKGYTPGNDYIQLLVDGKNTCSEATGGDSIANLSGIAIYDTNLDSTFTFRGNTYWGIGSGKYRFPAKAPWDSISFGTQILVYNDKNINSDIPKSFFTAVIPNFHVIPLSSLEIIDSANVDTASIPSRDSILPSPQGLGFSNKQGVVALLKNPIDPPNFTTSVSDWQVGLVVNGADLPANNLNATNDWIKTLLIPATSPFKFTISADPRMQIFQIGFDTLTLKPIYDTVRECAPKQVLLTKGGLTLNPKDVNFTWYVDGVADTIFTVNGAGLTDTTYYGGDTLTVILKKGSLITLIGTTELKCITGKNSFATGYYTRPSVVAVPPPLHATITVEDTLSKPFYNHFFIDTSGVIDSSLLYVGFCKGSRAKFHAHPDSSSSSDKYEWIRNGVVVSFDSTYIDSNIVSGVDTLLFHMNSNVPCIVKKDLYDTIIIRGLDSIPVPTIKISGDSSICANGIDTFRAVLSTDAILDKMDTSARYQLEWFVGGSLAFRDTLLYHDTDGVKKTFVANNFAGALGDSTVYAVLIAKKTQSCPYYDSTLTIPPDTLVSISDTIHMHVIPVVNPTVIKIEATQFGLCMRPFIDSVQFTATTDSLNGAGSNPKFIWYKNGVIVQNGPVSLYAGTDSARIGTDTVFSIGDTSRFISNGGLYYGADTIAVQIINTTNKCFVVSDTSELKIYNIATFDPYPPPVSVTITSSQNIPFCKNDNVTSVLLSPSGTNLGTKPSYLWTLNGKDVYDSTPYVYNQVVANDTITLRVRSSVACTQPHDTAWAGLRVIITDPYTTFISIDSTVNKKSVCQNEVFTLYLDPGKDDRSLNNPATNFDIYINGNLHQPAGISLPLQISARDMPVGLDSIFVVMHSGEPCLANPNDTSNAIFITVNPIPFVAPITGEILGDGSLAPSVCVGSFKGLSETTLGGVWSVNSPSTIKVDPFGLMNGIDSAKVTGLAEGSANVAYTVTDPTTLCSNSANLSINVSLSSIAQDSMIYKFRCIAEPNNIDTIYNASSQGHWYTSDNSIATVQNYEIKDENGIVLQNAGIVTAVGNGKVYIYDSIYTQDCGNTVRIDTLVIGPPVIDSIIGNKTICLIPNGTIQLTAYVHGDTAHTWLSDRTDIATVDTNGLVTSVSAGVAHITYTAYNNCTNDVVNASSSVTIQVGPPTDAGTIDGANNLCVGTSNTFKNDVITGGVWSIKEADTLVATIDSLTGIATGKTVGTATIYYTVKNTCGAFSTSKSITVITAPTKYPITANDTIVCTKPNNNSLQLNNNATGGVWESLNTNLATIDQNSGLVTGISGGLATIRYTITQQCGSYHIDTVIIVGEPVKGDYTYNNPICSRDTLTITNNIRGANTYSWSVIKQDGNNLKTIDGNHAKGVFVGVDGGNATILFVAVNRCGSTLKDLSDSTNYVNIKVNSLPVVPLIAGNFKLCLKDTTTLTDAAVIKGDWSIDKTSIASLTNKGFVTALAAGTANVGYKVTDKTTGCHDSVSQVFTVNSLPVVPAIGGSVAVCHGRTITLKDSAAIGAVGTWSSLDPSIAGITTDGVVIGLAPSRSTTIKYVVVDANNCRDSVSSPIAVNAIPGIAPITGLIDSSICVGKTLPLSNNGFTGGVWTLYNSKATITSTGELSGVSVGTDTVKYQIITNGCDTAVTLPIRVTTPYVAKIDVLDGLSVPIGLSIRFHDSTVNKGVWSFYPNPNSNIVGSGQTVSVTGKTFGPDSLVYTITDNAGCKASTGVAINILKPLDDIYIPNFFSPTTNSKKENSTFKIFGQFITAIDFNVYSPWGALVYHTTDINTIGGDGIGWDGKYNGQEMPAGVYVYTARITVKDVDNKLNTITKKGSVNLVR